MDRPTGCEMGRERERGRERGGRAHQKARSCYSCVAGLVLIVATIKRLGWWGTTLLNRAFTFRQKSFFFFSPPRQGSAFWMCTNIQTMSLLMDVGEQRLTHTTGSSASQPTPGKVNMGNGDGLFIQTTHTEFVSVLSASRWRRQTKEPGPRCRGDGGARKPFYENRPKKRAHTEWQGRPLSVVYQALPDPGAERDGGRGEWWEVIMFGCDQEIAQASSHITSLFCMVKRVYMPWYQTRVYGLVSNTRVCLILYQTRVSVPWYQTHVSLPCIKYMCLCLVSYEFYL